MQARGAGDQMVWTRTLEREKSTIDGHWFHIRCTPHHMQGGHFVPTTPVTQDTVTNVLRTVIGADEGMAAATQVLIVPLAGGAVSLAGS